MVTRLTPTAGPSLFAAVLILVALGASPTDSAAQHLYEIRPKFVSGLVVRTEMIMDVSGSLLAVSLNAKKATAHTKGAVVVTYIEVKDDRPQFAEVTFELFPASKTVDGKTDETVADPPKTVRVKRSAGGQIEAQGAADLDQSMRGSLRQVLEPATFPYPPRPVSVGEEWSLEGAALPSEWKLTGAASGRVKCKLERLGEVRGRPTYDISVKGTLPMQVPDLPRGIQTTLKITGQSQIDQESGIVVRGDMQLLLRADAGTEIKDMVMRVSTDATFQLPGQLRTPGTTSGAEGSSSEVANPLAKTSPLTPFVGRFIGPDLSAEFVEQGDRIVGQIAKGAQRFNAVGRVDATRLVGTFDVKGTQFDFTAIMNGSTMVLTSGGTTYTMTRN
jgi:hypothetical protein